MYFNNLRLIIKIGNGVYETRSTSAVNDINFVHIGVRYNI